MLIEQSVSSRFLPKLPASSLIKLGRTAILEEKVNPPIVMNVSFALFLLQAQGGAGSFLFSLLPMVLIFGLLYFLILGPQRKRQQQMQEMLEALKVGDQIVTNGGLTGVITQFFEDRRFVQLRICESPAVRVKILRSSIAERVTELNDAKK